LPSGLVPVVEGLRAQAKEKTISPDDLFWLISSELATGNLAMAEVHLKEPIASEIRFLKLRAILQYRENNLTEAAEYFRTVIAKNPKDAEAEFNLGFILVERDGATKEALQLLNQASGSKSPQTRQRAQNTLDSLLQTNSR